MEVSDGLSHGKKRQSGDKRENMMNHRRKLHERLRCDSNIMLRLRKFRSCKNWRWCTDLSMQYTLSKYKDQNPIRTWLDCVNDLEENWRFYRTQRITMRSQLWREDKFSLTAIDIILKHEYSFWTFWRILTKYLTIVEY